MYIEAVLTMSTGPLAQDLQNFVRTSFYLEVYQYKFKNLIQTSKFKCSFPGLLKLPVKELYKNKFKNLIQTSKFKFSFRGLLKINRLRCCFELYPVFELTGKKGGELSLLLLRGDNELL